MDKDINNKKNNEIDIELINSVLKFAPDDFKITLTIKQFKDYLSNKNK